MPELQIAQDQNGAFHVMRSGAWLQGPFGRQGDAAREARNRGDSVSATIGRITYEGPTEEERAAQAQATPPAADNDSTPAPKARAQKAPAPPEEPATTVLGGKEKAAVPVIDAAGIHGTPIADDSEAPRLDPKADPAQPFVSGTAVPKKAKALVKAKGAAKAPAKK